MALSLWVCTRLGLSIIGLRCFPFVFETGHRSPFALALMNGFWTKRRFGLCAGSLTIVVALIVLWTPLQIQYHRWFVQDSRRPHHESPRRFRDYLSPRTIFWMMRG